MVVRSQPGVPLGKRRHPRYKFDADAVITVLRNGSQIVIPVRSLDVSLTGMSSQMGEPLYPGEVVNIELPNEDMEPPLRAMVANHKENRCGYKFLRPMLGNQRARLEQLVVRAKEGY